MSDKKKKDSMRVTITGNGNIIGDDNVSHVTKTHTQFHGSITGPVHTGSGNINIDEIRYGQQKAPMTKEEFLEALRNIRGVVNAAKGQVLPVDEAEVIIGDIYIAEKNAMKALPKPKIIKNKLIGVSGLLQETIDSGESSRRLDKLVSNINTLIETVEQLF